MEPIEKIEAWISEVKRLDEATKGRVTSNSYERLDNWRGFCDTSLPAAARALSWLIKYMGASDPVHAEAFRHVAHLLTDGKDGPNE